jgi:cell division protein FtsB
LVSQQYRWAVFIVIFALSAVYFFIFSESGLLERKNLEKEKRDIVVKIDALKSENERLQRLLNNYRKGEYPKEDILKSDYVKPGEKVIFFHGLDNNVPRETVKKASDYRFDVPLLYMRILWVVISSVVVLLMILYGRKHKEQ